MNPDTKKIIKQYCDRIDSFDFGDILWAIDQLPLKGKPDSLIINQEIYKYMLENYEPFYDEQTKSIAEALLREMDECLFDPVLRIKMYFPVAAKATKNNDSGNYDRVIEVLSQHATDQSLTNLIWEQYEALYKKKQKYSICAGYILRGMSTKKCEFSSSQIESCLNNPSIIQYFLPDLLRLISYQNEKDFEIMLEKIKKVIPNTVTLLSGILSIGDPIPEVYNNILLSTFDKVLLSPDLCNLFFNFPNIPTKRFKEINSSIIKQLPFEDKSIETTANYLKCTIKNQSDSDVREYFHKCLNTQKDVLLLIPIIANSKKYRVLKKEMVKAVSVYHGNIENWIESLKSLSGHGSLRSSVIKAAINGIKTETTKGHFGEKGGIVHGWREMAKIIMFLTTVKWKSKYTKLVLDSLSEAYCVHKAPLVYSSAKLLNWINPTASEITSLFEPFANGTGQSQMLVIQIFKETRWKSLLPLIEKISNESVVEYNRNVASSLLV